MSTHSWIKMAGNFEQFYCEMCGQLKISASLECSGAEKISILDSLKKQKLSVGKRS